MEKKCIKTGIFGGSFNPIHIGHLALANYLCEYEGLDELWFMVSPQNPLKKGQALADDYIRLKMVESATADYPHFHACNFEFQLPRPSYTVDTLKKLRESYPQREFILIIGADNWSNFHLWKSPDEILSHHSIYIYPRIGYPVTSTELPKQVRLIKTPILEVSSTFIRESIAKGKDIQYFLHPNVLQIIKQEHLYTESSRR